MTPAKTRCHTDSPPGTVRRVGHVEVATVSHVLPEGRQMLGDDVQATEGTVSVSGAVGVMRQFIGGPQGNGTTVRDLLLSVSPARIQSAAHRLDDAELAMMERDDEPTQLRYARALNDYAEAGGYDQEVHWDECCVAAI